MSFRHRPHRRSRTACVAIGMLALVASCSPSGGQSTGAAEVALEAMDGAPTSIADRISGRPLLVSMWAVWCQPCRRELPELQRISDEGSAVDVLAVNVGDDPQRIIAYLNEMSLDLPVVIDPVGDLLTSLDVSTVPATVLFAADGTILWSHLGAVSAQQVDEAVRTYASAT